MAGDWIKFERATPDKPEVFEMAGLLEIDPDAVVGKLMRVWCWFDEHTENGNAPVTVKALLNRISGVTDFCAAMKRVGWLHEDAGVLTLPHFNRHNGKTAKQRALTARRVADHKQKSNAKGNDAGVTNALPREEKRREEKSIGKKDTREGSNEEPQRRYLPKSERECMEFCFSIGLKPEDGQWLWEKWNGNGFKVGTEDVQNWQATARAWKRTNVFPSQKSNRNPQAQGENRHGKYEKAF